MGSSSSLGTNCDERSRDLRRQYDRRFSPGCSDSQRAGEEKDHDSSRERQESEESEILDESSAQEASGVQGRC